MLSKQEQILLSLMENLETMAVWQAKYILEKFFGCSNDQTTLVISALEKKGYIKTFKKDYIVRQARGVSFKRNTVASMSVALQFIRSEEDVYTIMKESSVYDITFIHQNCIYNCACMDLGNIAKIRALENQYEKLKKNIKISKIEQKTILIFSKTNDKNEVFEQVSSIDITFPYYITFVGDNDLKQFQKLGIYRTE